jgi:hypothetical protein
VHALVNGRFGWRRSAQQYMELYVALLNGMSPDKRLPERDDHSIAASILIDSPSHERK